MLQGTDSVNGSVLYAFYKRRIAGDAFDINDTDNILSLSMLRNTTKNIEYSYDKNKEEQNCVKIWIGHK